MITSRLPRFAKCGSRFVPADSLGYANLDENISHTELISGNALPTDVA